MGEGEDVVTKVLFLDIDGVLNGERVILSTPEKRGFNYLDPISIGLVRQILRHSGAKVVVSSTWRLAGDLEVIQNLKLVGFTWEDFHKDAVTPNLNIGRRGLEVEAWLKAHPEVTHYVCIDDDSDFLEGQNLVKTNGIDGISADNYYQALKFLEAKDSKAMRIGTKA